jgi:quinone-modifying oxidoreductase subunit QmoA
MEKTVISTDILVVGGGVSGLAAAVEAADAGLNVVLVEKEPFLGGMAIRMNRYFPKLCPPTCGLELNFKRIRNNPRIRVFTQAAPGSISGTEGDFKVTVRLSPRKVNDKCTTCGDCAAVCPVQRPDDFNYGLIKTGAIYLPHLQVFPSMYAVDSKTCLGSDCAKCVAVCRYGAIDLQMPERQITIDCSSIIAATGWQPYDAARLDRLGFSRFPNVITNMMMERLAAGAVQGGSPILRPSDGKAVSTIAFVQCAGSRDINHLSYCSGVCCMASLKQATYFKERNPDVKIIIFYIDIRAPGTQEDFYQHIRDRADVSLIRGKVTQIKEDPATKDLVVEAEDTSQGRIIRQRVDMAVLATGMVPADTGWIPDAHGLRDHGFVAHSPEGIHAAGCAKRPMDVSSSIRDATGTILKCMRSATRSRANGK